MIEYFRDLGQRIEDGWRAWSYEEERFPDLVAAELHKSPPIDHVSLTDIYDWIFGHHQGFQQPDKFPLFGEPSIQLYESAHFYIEVLFWRTATTDVHQHGFSGVFYVLGGSSVHSHWNFETDRRISSSMQTGRLELESTEILKPGDMKPIWSGNRLIHQLFHLEVPSVTIVVRTYKDSDQLPQFSYRSPGLAIAQADPDPLLHRRQILLDGMARGDLQGIETYALRSVEDVDLKTVYYSLDTLMRCRRHLPEVLFAECFQRARELHGEIVELFWSVHQVERRIRLVRSKRQSILDPAARFLLALLMLMPDRASIFKGARLRDSDRDEMDCIESWLKPVASPETIGFTLEKARAAIFRGLGLGEGSDEIIQRVGKIYGSEALQNRRSELLVTIQNMAESDLFYPLFSETPLRPAIGFPGD